MSSLSRVLLRLRRQALRCYEIVACAALLAIALAVVMPSAAGDGEAAPLQCGNIQSSTVVMKR